MAIDRGPWNALVDDDGSNLVGTIWNKAAIKTVILDPTDAAIAAAPTVGTWTPVDASGGVTLTVYSARYWRYGKLVVVTTHLGYPANSSGSVASISGLPVPNGPGWGGLYSGQSPVDNTYTLATNGSVIQIINATNGANRTNVQLSGATLIIVGAYITA